MANWNLGKLTLFLDQNTIDSITSIPIPVSNFKDKFVWGSAADGKLTIKSPSGDWIKGFQVNLGIGEVLDEETWGLYYGLRQALACHITKIEVESDSAILVKLILDSDVSIHPLGSLIDCCNALIKKFHSFSLKHIYRECNMVADCLAKNSIDHAYGVIEFDAPPIHAANVFLEDFDGATRVRRFGVGHSSGHA
ncbi:uncharacterized protein LOC133737520 [Rosa rugosa]|uniref:uncharacterized protein LOC133737520 n=1 Tax=Rosa rugosa TaxID=74645 RepID=UPI002B414B36|nr:uncharacterized protein LOC133737520 [Rosa rugosa]